MIAPPVPLPDFLVIGAFKSGTTSLISYLGEHPQIFLPWLQEPNFFGNERFSLETGGDPRPVRDTIGYGRARTETLGQYAALFRDAPPGAVIGEASPQYMRNAEACDRIRKLLPAVKLVGILRNPADRAFSDYSMFVRDGLERDDFDTAVRREQCDAPGYHYVYTGFYARQLRPYFETFPREQIRICLYEDFVEPLRMMHDLFAWLGVDPNFDPHVGDLHNVSGVPRNAVVATGYKLRRRLQPLLKPIVPVKVQRTLDHQLRRGLRRESADPKTRMHLLQDVYADDIHELETLLGRPLSHWLADDQPL
jgi:hypothetical protein